MKFCEFSELDVATLRKRAILNKLSKKISAHLERRVGNTEFDGFLARKLDVCFGKLILWLVAYGVKLLSDRKTLSFITDFFSF